MASAPSAIVSSMSAMRSARSAMPRARWDGALTLVEDVEGAELAALMGLDRAEDFSGAEAEDPELLIAIEAAPATNHTAERCTPRAGKATENQWAGQANLLDPHPLYRWPVIEQVSQATRGRESGSPSELPDYPPRHPNA